MISLLRRATWRRVRSRERGEREVLLGKQWRQRRRWGSGPSLIRSAKWRRHRGEVALNAELRTRHNLARSVAQRLHEPAHVLVHLAHVRLEPAQLASCSRINLEHVQEMISVEEKLGEPIGYTLPERQCRPLNRLEIRALRVRSEGRTCFRHECMTPYGN